MPPPRIYCDHAATSWPKSPAALEAAEQFMRHCGATSGRGAYHSARIADRWLSDARLRIARLIDSQEEQAVAFCSSGTYALNAALFGLLRPGEHVVTTAIEHNSVLRPLEQLRQAGRIEVSIAPGDASGWVDPQAAASLLRPNTAAIVVNHASNVTGAVQDLAPWRGLADQCGAWLMVDASQTLGYLPLSVRQSGADVLAAAGHKGLGGLPGSGVLWMRSALRERLVPLIYGGTGTASQSIDAVPVWPQSVEVGNHNLPAIVALAEVARERLDESGGRLDESGQPAWNHLLQSLLVGLQPLETAGQLTIHGHRAPPAARGPIGWLPIVSLTFADWDVHEMAAVLDASFGIEARAGLHCAALVHDAMGTSRSGGTLRLSFGHSTTPVEVEQIIAAFQALLS
jgi:cysteine desulfurase / selenocysteine lyase